MLGDEVRPGSGYQREVTPGGTTSDDEGVGAPEAAGAGCRITIRCAATVIAPASPGATWLSSTGCAGLLLNIRATSGTSLPTG